MTTVLSILGAIIVLGVLIMIHELGHFGMARALGFRVDEFAVGFGPKIFTTVKKGIRYSVRALPLGGFCKFHGEDEDGGEDPEAFNAQKPWKRLLVVLAGAVMNILFAFVLAVITLCAWGDYAVTIEGVNPGSPAEAAGILPGDVILEINGKSMVFDFSALEGVDQADSAEGVSVKVRRGDRDVTLRARDLYNAEKGKNMLGVTLNYNSRRGFSFGEALSSAGEFLVHAAKSLVSFFVNIFKVENLQDQVTGPVGTITIIGQAVRSGWETIFRLCLYLSLNLGIFNLIPFPGLDGSRALFILYEMIFRKPIKREHEGIIHLVGMAILLLFILYITMGDIRRLFGGA